MKHAVRRRTDPAEERARILEVAEEHFRRAGYRKTSVTDIAVELGMGPANIYRFFPSKDAIKEAVCMRVMGQVVDIAVAAARTRAPALEKLQPARDRHTSPQQDQARGGAAHARHGGRRYAGGLVWYQDAYRTNGGDP
jgi:AcrR family transcriptional regulator